MSYTSALPTCPNCDRALVGSENILCTECGSKDAIAEIDKQIDRRVDKINDLNDEINALENKKFDLLVLAIPHRKVNT